MTHDKLSAVVSLFVSIVVLILSFFQFKEVLPFEGKVKMKWWAVCVLCICLNLLALAFLLLFW